MRRLHCDTAPWHVFARGCRRLQLFHDDADHSRFLDILSYSLRVSGCRLWAFALMPNHYHLALEGSSDQVTACMRRLGRQYSRYHNQRYRLSGHTFDGPYQAFRQKSLLLMLWTIAYVFLNPVKGGLCTAPEDYPWSGYRCYLNLPGSPLPIDVDSLMSRVDVSLDRAWSLFHLAIEKELQRPPKPPFGRPTMVEVHLQQFGQLLDYAREHKERLRGEDPAKVAIYWARECGVAPRAIAKGLGLATSKEVGNVVRWLKERLDREPWLREVLELP